jgi:preflagellin peptidase FlaK
MIMLVSLTVELSVLVMMGIGSIQDIKRREIDDYVWFIALIPMALNVYTILIGASLVKPLLWGVELALLSGMGLLFYRLGLFGGADAKALIAIGLAMPQPLAPFRSQIGLFGISVFDNGVVLAVVYAGLLALTNVFKVFLNKNYLGRYVDAPIRTKLGIILYAHKTTVDEYLRKSYKLFLAERPIVDTQGSVVFTPIYGVRLDSEEETVDEFMSLVNAGKINLKDELWVSQGLPLVTFMFLGIIITPFTGDLVFHFIKILLH